MVAKVNNKTKRYKVEELKPVAQGAVKKAFQKAIEEGALWLTPEEEAEIFSMVQLTDDICTFELAFYPPDLLKGKDIVIDGDSSKDPFILARVSVNRYTKQLVTEPDIYLPPILSSQLPEIDEN